MAKNKNDVSLQQLIELPDEFSGVNLEVEGFHSLSFRDRQLALMCAVKSHTGKTYTEIAGEFGISNPRLTQIRQKKGFKEFEQYILDEIFNDLYSDVVLELRDIMKNEKSRSVRLKAVEMLLKSQGRMKNEHRHELAEPKAKSLDQLEKEVADLESEILDEDFS